MSNPDIRRYECLAQTTDTFGRVLCNSRHHHFVIDGPIPNGCPGEALTPPESFLAGVASCGAELMQVLARQQEIPLAKVTISIRGTIDRSNPVRPDVTVFNLVELTFTLKGVDRQQAEKLVAGFKARCPLYGTVAVATPEIRSEILVEA